MARRAVKGCCLDRHHRCPAGHRAHLPPHWPVATTLAAALTAMLTAALADMLVATLAATLVAALAGSAAAELAASLDRVHCLLFCCIFWAINCRDIARLLVSMQGKQAVRFHRQLSDVVMVTLSQAGRHSRNKKTKKQLLASTLFGQRSIISTNSCEATAQHSDVVQPLNMLVLGEHVLLQEIPPEPVVLCEAQSRQGA